MPAPERELRVANPELQAKLEELKRAQDDMENFLVSASIPTVFLDLGLRITRFTATMAELFHLTAADLGRPMRQLYTRFDWRLLSGDFQAVIGTGVMAEREMTDCETGLVYLVRTFPYLTSSGVVEGVILKLIDLTESKLADQRLHEYRKIIECTNDMIFVFDRDYRFMLANQAYLDCLGLAHEELIGRKLNEVLDPETLAVIEPQIEESFAGREVSFETKQTFAGKGGRDVLITYTPIGERDSTTRVACVIKDVTERTQLEEQLRHSQKMEAIGTLAGGIAHDFNNLLTVIAGYASLIRAEQGGSVAGSMAGEILATVERAADMTRGLLAFSRKQEVHLAPVDLNLLVVGLQKSLSRLISEEIELSVEPVGRPLVTLADRGQLEQVLMNLVVNARDAMPRGGSIVIRTGVGKGRVGTIAVSDDGVGISREVQERIFEPFFTTKEPGRGTGLGLSTCYGILEKHNGSIDVQSREGGGTTFTLSLPLSRLEAVRPDKTEECAACTGSETVLLVEDDDSVRDLTRMILEHHGYRVLAAKDGEDALRTFSGRDGEIHLLLTDVIMPRLNGRELCLKLRELVPGLRTVFMSGYPADVMSEKGICAAADYLMKPIKPNDLLEKIRQVLDRA